MSFNIVYNSKQTSSPASTPALDNKPLRTVNNRTKKHFRHENDKWLLFLEAAVFLSLLTDSVNGENVSPVTQRSTDIQQMSMPGKFHPALREEPVLNIKDMTGKPADDQGQGAALKRFSTVLRKSTSRKRTTMWFESAVDQCDYLALMCMRAYQTGKLCARTVYYYYYTFKNYCMMDYTNCMSRFEVWQAIHMGDCVDLTLRSSNLQMSEASSKLMDEVYVVEQDFGL